MPDKRVQPAVVKSQAIDQGLRLGQPEHAWLGVAALGQRRDRTHFHKAKAHGAQGVDAACVFVQAGGHAHAVGKAQARNLNRVVHLRLGVGPLQRRALGARQQGQGAVVRHLGVHAE